MNLRSALLRLPAGPAGIHRTLQVMKALTRAGRKNLTVRTSALVLTRGLTPKDRPGEIRVLHAFVRDRIRYVKDIRGVETVQAPEVTLELAQGDCDDKSILLNAMLESLGHKTRFTAVGARPNHFEHVFPEVELDGHWLPLETTEPVAPGWVPRRIETRMTMEV